MRLATPQHLDKLVISSGGHGAQAWQPVPWFEEAGLFFAELEQFLSAPAAMKP